MTRVLFVFLDGVGIGDDAPSSNPFLAARLPTLRSLLGEIPVLGRAAPGTSRAHAFPLDATLGIAGIPQSGTGQISLLTGRNAARLHGCHFGPWPPVGLRPLLECENVMTRAGNGGRSVAFANAYPSGYPAGRSTRLQAAPPLAALAAGRLTRHAGELIRGEAVASDIENTLWRLHSHKVAGGADIPLVSPEEAGANLGRIASGADLTVFAHYTTDDAGHGGRGRGRKEPTERMRLGIEALERVDGFLSGVLGTLPEDAVLVIASDHGNIEDVTCEHTRNPALGVIVGEDAARRAEGLSCITQVPGAILEWLGVH